MEKIKMIFDWLKTQPKWLKSIAVVVVALVAALLIFSSCSSIRSTIPNIQENNVGAEGVISKEKNVSRQTKWFFKPEDVQPSNS